MTELAAMKCEACRGDEPPLPQQEIDQLIQDLPEWEVVEVEGVNRLQRSFSFSDFASALQFTNQVGEAAEDEGHHPRLVTEWGKAGVAWWTHKIGGLHQNDFIMAAKTDQVYSG